MLRFGFSALVALLLYTESQYHQQYIEITLAVDDISKREETCEKRFLESKAGKNHSACLPASPWLRSSGVSEADKKKIVELHNAERKIVSPTATNMLKMSWDEGIAKIAQGWANTCPDYHDSGDQKIDVGRYDTVTQNMAMGPRSWTDAFNRWANEKNYYDYVKNTKTINNPMFYTPIGHYTQVVWADTYKVGCGYAECDTRYNRFYICNYAPGGNYRGAWPYKSGSSCAECPDHCEDGLCDCGNIQCYDDGKHEFKKQDCSCNCKHDLVPPDCTEKPANCTAVPMEEEDFCFTWSKSYTCNTKYRYDCPYTCNKCEDCGYVTCYSDGKLDCSQLIEPEWCADYSDTCDWGDKYKCAFHCGICKKND